MEPRVSYLVGRLDRLLRRRLGEALAPHGLSLPEYTTLSVLHFRSGLSNAELARRSLITPQAMNEVLTRLEERGLVRRRVDPDHGRVRPAELTPRARVCCARPTRLSRPSSGRCSAVRAPPNGRSPHADRVGPARARRLGLVSGHLISEREAT